MLAMDDKDFRAIADLNAKLSEVIQYARKYPLDDPNQDVHDRDEIRRLMNDVFERLDLADAKVKEHHATEK